MNRFAELPLDIVGYGDEEDDTAPDTESGPQ